MELSSHNFPVPERLPGFRLFLPSACNRGNHYFGLQVSRTVVGGSRSPDSGDGGFKVAETSPSADSGHLVNKCPSGCYRSLSMLLELGFRKLVIISEFQYGVAVRVPH